MPEYTKCNLCGFDSTEIVQHAEEPFEVVKCKNCGLVYTNPQPDRDLVQEHYSEEYYEEWMKKQMDKRILMWKKRLKELLRYKSEGRLLDIGCGLGTFLKLARDRGFDVHGTEISEYACKYIRNTLNIDVFWGELRDAPFESQSFDVVTMWHTIEHVLDPKDTLHEVNKLLKNDGLLIVAAPNLYNYITRVLYFLAKRKRLKLFSSQAKEPHLYHFSPNTLASMLEATGFDIEKINLDLAQIQFPKKILDYLTAFFFLFTRRNFGEAMKVYAAKAVNQ